MIPGKEPIDRIRTAHRLVVRAAKCWDAGNVAAVEECVAVLEESAAELRAVEEAAIGRVDSLRGVRSEILEIQERVAPIERLSDLAAAFLRGGAGTNGASPLYRAGGFEETELSPTATTRIQA
jgi:hypothetical protein